MHVVRHLEGPIAFLLLCRTIKSLTLRQQLPDSIGTSQITEHRVRVSDMPLTESTQAQLCHGTVEENLQHQGQQVRRLLSAQSSEKTENTIVYLGHEVTTKHPLL